MPRPILTAEAMRAAEQAAVAAGTPVEELMERAGAAMAEAVYRYAGPVPALVLCGPGNNGGDGYVAARHLAERGVEVRVAALAEPKTEAAIPGEFQRSCPTRPATPQFLPTENSWHSGATAMRPVAREFL